MNELSKVRQWSISLIHDTLWKIVQTESLMKISMHGPKSASLLRLLCGSGCIIDMLYAWCEPRRNIRLAATLIKYTTRVTVSTIDAGWPPERTHWRGLKTVAVWRYLPLQGQDKIRPSIFYLFFRRYLMRYKVMLQRFCEFCILRSTAITIADKRRDRIPASELRR